MYASLSRNEIGKVFPNDPRQNVKEKKALKKMETNAKRDKEKEKERKRRIGPNMKPHERGSPKALNYLS